jgi:hypothetical protein
MQPIRLPRVAAKMKSFVEVETASHGRAIEIKQTSRAAIVTASDGHQLCRIQAPAADNVPLEPVEPFLVDGREFAKAAAAVGCSRTEKASPDDRPLVVVRFDDKDGKQFAGIAGPEGAPQTLAVPYGKMPDCAGIIERIQGEVASGMTRAVVRVDPHFLQSLADTAVAMGITSIEIAFAPRWNFMLAEGTAPDGCAMAVAIAGIGDIQHPATTVAVADHNALTFVMPQPKAKRSGSRKQSSTAKALPFPDDIPF